MKRKVDVQPPKQWKSIKPIIILPNTPFHVHFWNFSTNRFDKIVFSSFSSRIWIPIPIYFFLEKKYAPPTRKSVNINERSHAANKSIIVIKMMREGVVHLLQERFRQLQRMKELREEKEMLSMMMYNSSTITTTTTIPTTRSCNNSEVNVMLLPPKPHYQLSLSLWPAAECRGTPRFKAPSPSNLSTSSFTDHNSASDIDTSLHLWCNNGGKLFLRLIVSLSS